MSKRNADFQDNHAKISDAYMRLVARLKRRPTNKELAEESGFSDRTVRDHVKELRFKPHKHPARLLTDNVIHGLAAKASTGNAESAKLWLQVMEGWTEKSSVDINVIDRAIERELARLATGGQAETAGDVEAEDLGDSDQSSLETESGTTDEGV